MHIVSQVHELHRLYQIQKLLMKTIGSGVTDGGNPLNLAGQIDRTDRKSQKGVGLGRPADSLSPRSEGTRASETIEESQIELTLGPPSYRYSTSKPRPKKGDAQLTSSSFSSSSTWSSDNGTSGKLGSFGPLAVVKEDQFLKSERLNHPPWIFQALSLNSTWRWSFCLSRCERLREFLYPGRRLLTRISAYYSKCVKISIFFFTFSSSCNFACWHLGNDLIHLHFVGRTWLATSLSAVARTAGNVWF